MRKIIIQTRNKCDQVPSSINLRNKYLNLYNIQQQTILYIGDYCIKLIKKYSPLLADLFKIANL